MKAAFPSMGVIHIVLEPMICELGAEVIVPPPPTDDTVATGSRLAPEAMCLPFKVTLGNMLQCLKAGADTLIYTTGSWSCRFGYYGRMQAEILRDAGYRFELIELSHESPPNTIRAIMKLNAGSLPKSLVRVARAFRLGWLKSAVLDRVAGIARRTMPFASSPQVCWDVLRETTAAIQIARTPKDLTRIQDEVESRFAVVRVTAGPGRCVSSWLVRATAF